MGELSEATSQEAKKTVEETLARADEAPQPVADEPTQHLDDRIAAAKERIHQALQAAQEGSINTAELQQALRVECRELKTVVPAYAKRAGHDPQLVVVASELRYRAEQIILYGN